MGVRGCECSLQEGLMRAQEGRAGAPSSNELSESS